MLVRKTFAAAFATIALAGGLGMASAGTATAAPTSTVGATANACSQNSTYGYHCDYYYGSATISYGSSNAAAVREIQALINQTTPFTATHTALVVDGSFGPKTLAAVKWIQSTYGIQGGADGIVGYYTWRWLRWDY